MVAMMAGMLDPLMVETTVVQMVAQMAGMTGLSLVK